MIGSVSNYAIAESDTKVPPSSISIKKGDTAPFEGVLLSNTKANEMFRAVIERDSYIDANISYKKTTQIQELQITKISESNEILRQQNKNLYDSLVRDKSMNNYERILWFGLGVIGTGAAVYGAGKLLR